MRNIFYPILKAFEEKGYKISSYNNGDYFENDENPLLCEYSIPFIAFENLKETKEKDVAKFLFSSSVLSTEDIDVQLDSSMSKAMVGIMRTLNEGNTDAAPVRLDGLKLRWYIESEIRSTDDGNKAYFIYFNCPSADPINEQRFNPYYYYNDLWLICSQVAEVAIELAPNPRFYKMY